ncbi:MAG: glycosyltransferase family 39 protein [Anaerolineae bacterium]
MFKPRSRWWLALLVLALATFALRIFKIQAQSLWYDEAFSVWLARLDLGDITARTAADIQPPLYYYLLHFWMLLTGVSEFAVRFLSLVPGVLTIPLMYVMARRLFNRAAAFAAALLALVSPLYLWYSQETRMYTLITFLGLLSSYALLRATGERRNRWWVVFALANIAAIYTHYFAFVIIAFQVLYWLGNFSIQHSAFSIRNSLLAFFSIPLAFLPWAPLMLNRLGEDASYWRGPLKVDEAVRHIFISLTMGESVLEGIAQVLATGWMIVLLVGIAAYVMAQWRDRKRTPVAADGREQETHALRAAETHFNPAGLGFAILYLVVPLALLLFLFYRNPKFNARYLMLASPGLMLLLGAGLASLWALLRARNKLGRVIVAVVLAAGAVTLLGTAVYADDNAYFDPAFTKADFRGVAQYIASNAGNDEAVVLTSGHLFPAFDYYYPSANLPELRLPDDPTLNTDHVLGYPTADALNRGLAGKRGVWLVQWQDEVVDPNGVVPLLLSSRGTEQKVDASFWQVKLRHWSLPADAHFSNQPEVTVKRTANFKNKAQLLGLATPNPTPADQGASFNLYWQALDTFADDYQVALRIVDAQGNIWGRQDRRPAGYTYPTTRWNKGENLFGAYTVPLLPGAPAGDYFVTVTFFTAADQTGLDVLAANGAPVGKSFKLGPVKVLPAQKQPNVLDLKIQHTVTLRAGPLTLLGYNLGREQASTGEAVPVSLFWRVEEPPAGDYRFQIQFGDKASAALPLANDAYPTAQWHVGEIVRGQYLIQVPPDASAGQTDLQVKLVGPDTRTVDLTQPFTIQKTDRVFVAPQAVFKQDANFSNLVGLSGYNVSAPQIRAGDTLTVTLNWKALGKMDRPYTVFVHLLDKESKPWGQKDAQPLGGGRPTPTWVEGEYLSDAYAFQVKPDAPPGEYRVEIGWYDAADPTFARLQVIDANGGGAGDRVLLDQPITIIQ